MTAYSVLGISVDASPRDIQLAYKRALRRAHPDMGGSPEEFQRVQDAYKSIMEDSPSRTILIHDGHPFRYRKVPA